jgi:1-carboxybiuret hydrolase subunit AtzH-like protein
MLEIDLPEVKAELVEAFAAYELALTTNDIPKLNELFWDSELTVRYGVRETERQYSHAEIARFRLQRGAVNRVRVLRNQRITTFGRDLGIANTEFLNAGSDKVGRQSQTWVRTDKGWRIVGAHVSVGYP